MVTAWEQVRLWRSAENVWVPNPTERHGEVLERLLMEPGIRGDLVPDAHLAALAIEHGLILCSTDGDFARFPGLRWENPIKGS
jgi:predicted nucleic acid-binding protein